MRDIVKSKKKERLVVSSKQMTSAKIKEILKEKGKTEEWFTSELKKKHEMNKQEAKDILSGKSRLSILNSLFFVAFTLGVSPKEFFTQY